MASLTGVPLGDQLLLFAGQKLEPTKPLGTYGLPEASGTAAPGPQSVHGDQTQHVDEKPRHVFLYCKSLLRPDAPAPPETPFEHVPIDPPPPAPPRSDGTHPLDAASSPLIRALPDYERQFRHHRQSAAAVWRATQARFEECRRLVTEMHVQALAIDSARDNVDHHFNYICRCQGEFERTHAAQNAAHSELLQCFDADMETLENTGLHPAVIEHCARRHEEAKKAAEGENAELEGKVDGGDKQQSHGAADVSSVTGSGSSANESAGDIGPVDNVVSSTESTGSAGGEGNFNPKPRSAPASLSRPAPSVTPSVTVPPCRKNLLDCIPAERVRRWAQDCARSHDAFNAKVNDLSDMFNALHATTEELFMTGPDVDIAALEEELERAQGKMAEQAAVIQCLDKDLNTVGRLVEDTVGDIASNRGGTGSVGGGALDACAALDPMNELHVKSHLPAVDAVDAEMAALHWHCAQCKHAMGACVHRQLQSISALQSQIHQTRNKQAGFQEWGKQQEQKFRELRIARRIPRVYRACLAEVARRLAFQEMYSAQAGKLAERMARHREREVTRRERFTKSHERYLPPEVVAGLGLGASPPQCEVTVTRSSEETIPPLAPVTEEDLRRIGADARTAWMDPTGADVDPTGADVSPPESPARSPVEAAAAELLGSLALDDDSENDDDKDGEPGVSLGDGAMTRSRAGLDGDLFLENARLRADLAANVALLATIDGDRVRASKSAQTSQVLRDSHATGVGVQTSRGTLAMGRSVQTSWHSSEGIGVQTSQTLEGVSTQTSLVLESEETRSETARVLAALHAREEEAGALRRELRRVTAVLRRKESYVESLERAADATRGSVADPGRSPTPDPLSALM